MDSTEFISNYYLFYILYVICVVPLFDSNLLKNKSNVQYGHTVVIVSCVFLILFFGFRDENVGTDTINYVISFENMQSSATLRDALEYSLISRDPFFNGITYYLSKFLSVEFYLSFLAFVYVFTIYKAFKIWDKKNVYLYFLVILSLVYFISMGINIIRSGLSASFAILGFVILVKEKRIRTAIICFGLSTLIHYSGIVVAFITFFVYFSKFSIRWFYILALFCLGLAYFGYSLKNLPILGEYVETSERMTTYISNAASQAPSGVNPYVVLFQLFPLLYGFYYICFRQLVDNEYIIINKIYLLTSSLYFLSLNINFSDRFGALSWIFIPFIFCYPLTSRTTRSGIKFTISYMVLLSSIAVLFILGVYRLI